ncbi:hypothetical protein GQ607_003729 [Colletotrichum asianum]|uniref:Uncharacterized protein n=1 Tax=Colletotrichum asianum TaxID=702518 RepID=A0A8H3WNF2_9PEZI|nr:hypothetical protein GQ607_003729 [Colletotrichum asianum]
MKGPTPNSMIRPGTAKLSHWTVPRWLHLDRPANICHLATNHTSPSPCFPGSICPRYRTSPWPLPPKKRCFCFSVACHSYLLTFSSGLSHEMSGESTSPPTSLLLNKSSNPVRQVLHPASRSVFLRGVIGGGSGYSDPVGQLRPSSSLAPPPAELLPSTRLSATYEASS